MSTETPKPRNAETPPPALCFYEVTMPGHEPLKISGVLAYNTARLRLTKDQADAILAGKPNSLKFLGI